MNKLITVIAAVLMINSTSLMAEIKTYESTDNSGLNKQERIETVEKYLVDLSAALRSMENKLDDNAKKLKSLDDVVKAIKVEEDKKIGQKLGEKKEVSSKDLSELDKIKADVLSMKNQDIEKLKTNFDELSYTVKALQATIREQQQNAK